MPLDSQKNLLHYWAESMGKPASMLRAEDLVIPTEQSEDSDIAGLTLSGLYNYYNTDKERGKSGVMTYMLSRVGIKATAEDVVRQAQTPQEIFWERVPVEEIGKILTHAAHESASIPAFLGYDDLENRFAFLNDRTLTGIRHYMNRHDLTLPQLLREAGIQPSYTDLLQQIQSERPVPWGRVDYSIMRVLIEDVGTEQGRPPQMVVRDHLGHHHEFLGGKTLEGFYKFFLYHPEKPEEKSAMAFMRQRLGFPPFPSLRNYRLREIRRSLSQNEIVPEPANYSLDLLTLAKNIGKLYEQKKFGLTAEEMTNEAIASVMENSRKGYDVSRIHLSRAIHADLEAYLEAARQTYYNVISLDHLIEDEETHSQRKDLGYISEGLVTQFEDEYSELVLDEISLLTPTQRHIAREVIFRRTNVATVAQELGITDDELDEHFDDASTLISDWFRQEEGLFVA